MLQFRDYTINDCMTNNAYSIEMELETNILNLIQHKVWINSQLSLSDYGWTSEYSSWHRLETPSRISLMEMVEDAYRYKMYYWGDRYTSWWNHFHVFFPSSDGQEVSDFISQYSPAMRTILETCPLYAMYYDKTGFHKRFLNWCQSWQAAITNSKWSWLCRNGFHNISNPDSTVYTLEFRINQVYDRRLYGYYLAVMLMAIEWVSLPHSIEWKQAADIWNWVKNTSYQIHWRWHYDIRSNKGTDVNKQNLKANVKFMIDFLRERWFNNSALMLESYGNEKWILTPGGVGAQSSKIDLIVKSSKWSIPEKILLLS